MFRVKPPPAAVLRFLPLFYARLIGKVRIIAANVRTAAVYPRAGDSPEFRPRPLMRVMDGCVLLAVVFNLIRGNFTCYEALNRPFAISRLTWCAEISLATKSQTVSLENLNFPLLFRA